MPPAASPPRPLAPSPPRPAPPHRVLTHHTTQLLDLGASSGLDLTASVALLRAPAHRATVAALADYPMRCLSFAAQVRSLSHPLYPYLIIPQ